MRTRITDTLVDFWRGLGTQKDPTRTPHWEFREQNRWEQEKMYRGDFLARKLVDAPAEDATREWRQWHAEDKKTVEAIQQVEIAHKLQKKTKDAITRARLYGGAALVLGVDQGESDEPLDVTKCGKGSLKFIAVMNRYELNAGPRIYNVDSPWYTRPEYYVIATPIFGFSFEGGRTYPTMSVGKRARLNPPQRQNGGTGWFERLTAFGRGDPSRPQGADIIRPRRWQRSQQQEGDLARQNAPYAGMVHIHPSRVIEFAGNELPDWRLAPLGGGWGDSILQTVEDTLKKFGVTLSGVSAMVNDAKMDVVKVQNLEQHLGNDKDTAALIKRFAVSNQNKSLYSLMLLDEKEEWERIKSEFAGLPDLLEKLLMIACGAGGVPVSRVMGQQGGSGGISAKGGSAGENDLRNYLDGVSTYQKTEMTPRMSLLDELIVRSAIGRYDPAMRYNWNALWQLTDSEKAEIAAKKAQAANTYVQAALFNEDVVRAAVSNMIIADDLFPGWSDAVDEFGLEPQVPVARVWSPGFDPHTGLSLMQEGGSLESGSTGEGGEGEGGEEAARSTNSLDARRIAARAYQRGRETAHFEHLSDAFMVNDVWGPAAWEASAAVRAAHKVQLKRHGRSVKWTAPHPMGFGEALRRVPGDERGSLTGRGMVRGIEFFAEHEVAHHVAAFLGKHTAGIGMHMLMVETVAPHVAETMNAALSMIGQSPETMTAYVATGVAGYALGELIHKVRGVAVAHAKDMLVSVGHGLMKSARAARDIASDVHAMETRFGYNDAMLDARTGTSKVQVRHALSLFVEALERHTPAQLLAAGQHFAGEHRPVRDAIPRTMYVYRPVLNGDTIVRWAKSVGFETALEPADMHVTIAYSKKPVDWSKAGEPMETVTGQVGFAQPQEGRITVPAGGARQLQKFSHGGDNAIVLLFNSSILSARHEEIHRLTGADWSHPDYQPHITITYRPPAKLDSDEALRSVPPFRGEIELGAEVFEEIDATAQASIIEDGGHQ
jgi:hypothetical protein